MYEVIFTNQFSKDYKKSLKRKCDIGLLNNLIETLAASGVVPLNCKPHILSGMLSGY